MALTMATDEFYILVAEHARGIFAVKGRILLCYYCMKEA